MALTPVAAASLELISGHAMLGLDMAVQSAASNDGLTDCCLNYASGSTQAWVAGGRNSLGNEGAMAVNPVSNIRLRCIITS